MMSPQELFREINRGNLLPLYYFWGPEKWLIDEALKKLEEKTINPATRDFNREVLDGREDGAEAILASLQVFPIRSPWRMVIIRNSDWTWKKTTSSFSDYFHNPNPRTCAVFVGEKTDQRTKFFQALEEKGAVIAFFPLYEKDLHRWVHARAEELSHSISEEAVSLLLERVGFGLRDIHTELQKIILGKEAGKRIEEGDILALTEDSRSESPFDLARAVGRLDPQESLRMLGKNLQQGDPPIFLFSLLIRQFRLIRRAKNLLLRGCSKKEVERTLRILPRSAQDFWRQVDRFSHPLLENLWPVILKADRELKLARSDKHLLLEEFILSLLVTSGGIDRVDEKRKKYGWIA